MLFGRVVDQNENCFDDPVSPRPNEMLLGDPARLDEAITEEGKMLFDFFGPILRTALRALLG